MASIRCDPDDFRSAGSARGADGAKLARESAGSILYPQGRLRVLRRLQRDRGSQHRQTAAGSSAVLYDIDAIGRDLSG